MTATMRRMSRKSSANNFDEEIAKFTQSLRFSLKMASREKHAL